MTLCWDCENACNGGCTWSEKLEPVDGWTAQKTANGYVVHDCPEFKRDAYEGGAIRPKDYRERLIRRQIRYEGKKSLTLHPIALTFSL